MKARLYRPVSLDCELHSNGRVTTERKHDLRVRLLCSLYCVDSHESALCLFRHHVEAKLCELSAEFPDVVKVACGFPDVEPPIEAEAPMRLANVVSKVRPHEREAEDGD